MSSGPVVHLNTNDRWGGGEAQVIMLLNGLRSRKYPARLFAHPDGRLLQVAREQELDAHPLPYTTLAKSGRGASTLCQMLRHHAPRLLHAHDSLSTTLAIRCSRALDTPAIMTRRVASPIRNNWFSRRKYAPGKLAAIACISETVRQSMMESSQYPESELHLIRSACDVDHLSTIQPLKEFEAVRPAFKVGGVGTLSTKKNWGLMIETAALLKDGPLDIHWYLAGTGPEEDRLREFSNSKGVADRVHFLGFREDATAVTRSMDAYFFPSIMEGAGVSLFEAMAMGIPVIISDTPGTVETVGDSGWVVAQNDTGLAAAAVTEALTDETLRESRTRAATGRLRQRHSIMAMTDRYQELYATLS